jgi:hypothetical protein
MRSRSIIILVVILLLAVGFIFLLGGDAIHNSNDNPDQTAVEGEDNGIHVDPSDNPDLRIDSLDADERVSSPLTITGAARGWYFEASFPVKLLDAAGNVVAQAPAQAQGDWMTSDFVPFEVTLTWSGNTSGEGTVVFAKDNPSGLPANDAEVRVPVEFGDGVTRTTQPVKVYFSSSDQTGNDCAAVAAVTRQIPSTQAVATAALQELLAGPTAAEKQAGYTSSIPTGVKLNSIRVENGTAFADFSTELNQGGGSCLVTAIRAQIEKTLEQFSTVNKVEISVAGDTDDVLQP